MKYKPIASLRPCHKSRRQDKSDRNAQNVLVTSLRRCLIGRCEDDSGCNGIETRSVFPALLRLRVFPDLFQSRTKNKIGGKDGSVSTVFITFLNHRGNELKCLKNQIRLD